jgi:hypothetical protein
VRAARVDYGAQLATIAADGERAIDAALGAIAEQGFEGAVVRQGEEKREGGPHE